MTFSWRLLFLGVMSLSILLSAMSPFTLAKPNASALPDGFVYLDSVVPEILQDLRYFGSNNFLGRPVDGYHSGRCILTRQAAEALGRVQHHVSHLGLSLKVYDCYRPQTAVNDFAHWAANTTDQAMKPFFYPHVDKRLLFKHGYIALHSSHSRGSTVDITLVPIAEENQATIHPNLKGSCTSFKHFKFKDTSLDMGTAFDCFDPKSHTDSPQVSRWARKNRLLLKTEMAAQGFRNLPEEWWHYTLNEEPFPQTYFDFPIK